MSLQKIVMSYTDTDGCTYACDENKCFYAESVEAALVTFEAFLETAIKSKQFSFNFMGTEFTTRDFYIGEYHPKSKETVYDPQKLNLPYFYTLEEWFDVNNEGVLE